MYFSTLISLMLHVSRNFRREFSILRGAAVSPCLGDAAISPLLNSDLFLAVVHLALGIGLIRSERKELFEVLQGGIRVGAARVC